MKGRWTCQRVTAGEKCGHDNPNRYRVCRGCGKRRPAKRRPAHLSALALPMAYYEQLNGGSSCGICGKSPKPGEKFHRDHEHKGVGFPRGVLCWPCNALLPSRLTLERARQIVAYLERAEARRPESADV